MSTETDETAEADGPELDIDAAELEELRARVDELEDELAAVETEVDDGQKSMVIIATKGTLDMAYPPLILASTAAAFGWDVTVFHTFWGLDILHEEHSQDLQMSSVGNPNMPVPNAIASLPGMDRVTTKMMRKRIDDNDTASIDELLDTCFDMGVEMQACQMTIELMDYDEDDFYDDVTVGVGAATALEEMADADIQLLV
ncbi:Peroxiredoxin family protein [Halorientalis persicus]|jgi:peroxiredoxin family protein|uniref:Peroxiredoxin family protein n=1 Tax=Halorientalis persicus TaxID=1367881 RepID=A0A1H8RS34_9EURY|nr:DsrE/DsrF/DrsH-like family protein [Halorientalis persicus]SEO69281.1 Peroxiredoxin family protein [Halorientalis persicus]